MTGGAAQAENGLLSWAVASLGDGAAPGRPRLEPVAGDASGRRYFRLYGAGAPVIAVHAPPETEKNREFVAARDLLARAGVRVPALLAADPERGFLLLEDLGSRLLLDELDSGSVDGWYTVARGILLRLAEVNVAGLDWPAYDRALLAEELERFPVWFVEGLLELPAGPARPLLAEVAELLLASALEQPRVLVHRDFHSRNLMPQPDGRLAVIDFQDAVVGPVTYDLVSLLRDCYVRWPDAQVRDWALEHHRALLRAGRLSGCGQERFLRWFDLMGLQRHLKVLGTFARLDLRDGKSGYLADLPLVLRYVRETLRRRAGEEPALAALEQWFDESLAPRIAAAPWGKPA